MNPSEQKAEGGEPVYTRADMHRIVEQVDELSEKLIERNAALQAAREETRRVRAERDLLKIALRDLRLSVGSLASPAPDTLRPGETLHQWYCDLTADHEGDCKEIVKPDVPAPDRPEGE